MRLTAPGAPSGQIEGGADGQLELAHGRGEAGGLGGDAVLAGGKEGKAVAALGVGARGGELVGGDLKRLHDCIWQGGA